MASSSTKLHDPGIGIRIQNLSKSYGHMVAVNAMNLTINPGELISFLGPSGSGKTTTLMMIAGFVPSTKGEIFIADQPVAKLPPQKRGLGMVFQNYALFPHMTVAENVAFPLKMRGLPRAECETRVREALSMVKLDGFETRYPRQLSGGQQQRVALARAIVFRPKALLMDEPLGALDKKLREHMQLEIKSIQERLGVTVIYVTHDQEEALTMSDRIVVMRDGRIEQIGSPTDLYDDPRTAFVADFIGETNLIDGRISRQAGSIGVIEAGDGRLIFGSVEGKLSHSSAVKLCVRPERVRIQPPQAVRTSEENVYSGKIEEVIYVGDATKLRVNCNAFILTVKVPNNDERRNFMIGGDIAVSWSPDSAKILAA
ncbi:ABC transporter ATP-binding protein [Brucella pseudogrignonensis]|uniref:ABC transporter ATP-binding protein n=1 Tax=Brucella pseudogrignonensis TaxID=419475 RepID=UPI003ECEFAEB